MGNTYRWYDPAIDIATVVPTGTRTRQLLVLLQVAQRFQSHSIGQSAQTYRPYIGATI